MVTELFAVTYFGIAALAVLWNYSAMPKIDWKFLLSGALLMLTAAAVSALDTSLITFGVVATTTLVKISAILTIIAVIFIMVGALQQIAAKMK